MFGHGHGKIEQENPVESIAAPGEPNLGYWETKGKLKTVQFLPLKNQQIYSTYNSSC